MFETRPAVDSNPAPETAEDDLLARLLGQCRPGWSLPREFYSSEFIYRLDLERIWRTQWLFAGHSCQIHNPGDYFTLEVGDDSLIIIRAKEGAIHALHNVCRHRGSIICGEPAGHVHRLVCPYHQWTYALDGTLVGWRGMQEQLDKSQFRLRAIPIREVAGLLYICLAPAPPDFEAAATVLGGWAQPQGFSRAKVAKSADYTIQANWKLVWENNRECYHCDVNHPQYIKANFDHYNADDRSERIRREIAEAVQRSEEKWARAGLAVSHKETGMTLFPDAQKNIWYSANRTPLVQGYLSESMDGQPVAPLMGEYPSADVGTLRMRTLPNFWNHSSCDHAVTTRLLPAGPQTTVATVLWLVDREAVEGRDYQLEKLLPFWQLTSEQDWKICANQQRGVNSSAYQPGPYSTYKEYNVDNFVRWYLKKVGERAGQNGS